MTDSTEKTMHIDPYERNWIRIGIGFLVFFAIMITVAGFAFGIQVPTDEGRVDPQTLSETPPWSEPGLREIVPGEEYEAYVIARRFSFDPREMTVPKGAKVTFYSTSADVQHGFALEGTNVNMMVVPGQVSKLSATFDTPGTYDFICHEYCGLGHAVMYGTLTVEG
ncbi:MAG: cytochrome c oxidase subunit II [Actinomycetota bacterium]